MKRHQLEEKAEECLRQVGLRNEVKDRLHHSALSLSGGQQQRLGLARVLAVKPEVILLDEPCSALDPVSTARIEELLAQWKDRYTIILVTHNMQQAARISDYTAFLYDGRLVEYRPTELFFIHPLQRQTEAYITGQIPL